MYVNINFTQNCVNLFIFLSASTVTWKSKLHNHWSINTSQFIWIHQLNSKMFNIFPIFYAHTCSNSRAPALHVLKMSIMTWVQIQQRAEIVQCVQICQVNNSGISVFSGTLNTAWKITWEVKIKETEVSDLWTRHWKKRKSSQLRFALWMLQTLSPRLLNTTHLIGQLYTSQFSFFASFEMPYELEKKPETVNNGIWRQHSLGKLYAKICLVMPK